jgi:hypothetical protein
MAAFAKKLLSQEICIFCKIGLDGFGQLGYFERVRFGLFSVPAPLLRTSRTTGFFHRVNQTLTIFSSAKSS